MLLDQSMSASGKLHRGIASGSQCRLRAESRLANLSGYQNVFPHRMPDFEFLYSLGRWLSTKPAAAHTDTMINRVSTRPLRVAAIWRTRLSIYLRTAKQFTYLVHHITGDLRKFSQHVVLCASDQLKLAVRPSLHAIYYRTVINQLI